MNRSLREQPPSSIPRRSLGEYEKYIGMFDKFLREKFGKKKEGFDKQMIENLPNLFNDFVMALR